MESKFYQMLDQITVYKATVRPFEIKTIEEYQF